jgi:hypothetical protein
MSANNGLLKGIFGEVTSRREFLGRGARTTLSFAVDPSAILNNGEPTSGFVKTFFNQDQPWAEKAAMAAGSCSHIGLPAEVKEFFGSTWVKEYSSQSNLRVQVAHINATTLDGKAVRWYKELHRPGLLRSIAPNEKVEVTCTTSMAQFSSGELEYGLVAEKIKAEVWGEGLYPYKGDRIVLHRVGPFDKKNIDRTGAQNTEIALLEGEHYQWAELAVAGDNAILALIGPNGPSKLYNLNLEELVGLEINPDRKLDNLAEYVDINIENRIVDVKLCRTSENQVTMVTYEYDDSEKACGIRSTLLSPDGEHEYGDFTSIPDLSARMHWGLDVKNINEQVTACLSRNNGVNGDIHIYHINGTDARHYTTIAALDEGTTTGCTGAGLVVHSGAAAVAALGDHVDCKENRACSYGCVIGFQDNGLREYDRMKVTDEMEEQGSDHYCLINGPSKWLKTSITKDGSHSKVVTGGGPGLSHRLHNTPKGDRDLGGDTLFTLYMPIAYRMCSN